MKPAFLDFVEGVLHRMEHLPAVQRSAAMTCAEAAYATSRFPACGAKEVADAVQQALRPFFAMERRLQARSHYCVPYFGNGRCPKCDEWHGLTGKRG